MAEYFAPGWNAAAVWLVGSPVGDFPNESIADEYFEYILQQFPVVCNELKNCLLYADQVRWVDGGLVSAIEFVLKFVPCSALKSQPEQVFKALPPRIYAHCRKQIALREQFEHQIIGAGLKEVLVPKLPPGVLLGRTRPGDHFAREKRMGLIQFLVRVGEAILPTATSDGWETYHATHSLLESLGKIMLPDASQLPLSAIAELRERLSPILNPTRAELLRLTEDLRKLVGDDYHQKDLEREAANLIQVRVEPVVREAAQTAEELMKKKWRRFLQGLIKVFGFTGAALLKPDFVKDAIKEVVETGAAMVDREARSEPLADTARFVLEARRYIVERSTR